MYDDLFSLLPMKLNKTQKVMLFFIITGWIRVMFVLVPMGAIVWCKYTNCVTTDTEMIKK